MVVQEGHCIWKRPILHANECAQRLMSNCRTLGQRSALTQPLESCGSHPTTEGMRARGSRPGLFLPLECLVSRAQLQLYLQIPVALLHGWMQCTRKAECCSNWIQTLFSCHHRHISRNWYIQAAYPAAVSKLALSAKEKKPGISLI